MKQLSYSARYGNYTEVPYTTGSDYSGDVVTRSNYLALREELARYKGIYNLYGDYGTYGIGYVPEELTKNGRAKIEEIIEALEGYPVVDDERTNILEWELIEAQFENDHKYELRKYENENGDIPQILVDYAHTVIVSGIGDTAFIETGCIAYIDWDKVRAEIDACNEILSITRIIV